MSRFSIVLSSTVILAVTACTIVPTGPSVMVLPASGMSFDQFRNDDVSCQQFASYQLEGTSANDAAVESGITSAIIGSALGAAAGAILGGGNGAIIGAGSGLLAGSLAGVGASSGSMAEVQQRYDSAYIQCMYARGHQVPVSGQFSGAVPQPATPSSAITPPPPPNLPPPPPPTYTR